MNTILVTAIDPGFRHTGLAHLRINIDTLDIEVLDLKLVDTAKDPSKKVRVNSEDLRCAKEIAKEMLDWAARSSLVMAEVPSGAQSSRAATALGICTGVLGAVAVNHQIIQVMPGERGMATIARKTASKEQLIDWAVTKYPDAAWKRLNNKPTGRILDSNEHLADAIAIGHAGALTDQFKQLLVLLRAARPARIIA